MMRFNKDISQDLTVHAHLDTLRIFQVIFEPATLSPCSFFTSLRPPNHNLLTCSSYTSQGRDGKLLLKTMLECNNSCPEFTLQLWTFPVGPFVPGGNRWEYTDNREIMQFCKILRILFFPLKNWVHFYIKTNMAKMKI